MSEVRFNPEKKAATLHFYAIHRYHSSDVMRLKRFAIIDSLRGTLIDLMAENVTNPTSSLGAKIFIVKETLKSFEKTPEEIKQAITKNEKTIAEIKTGLEQEVDPTIREMISKNLTSLVESVTRLRHDLETQEKNPVLDPDYFPQRSFIIPYVVDPRGGKKTISSVASEFIKAYELLSQHFKVVASTISTDENLGFSSELYLSMDVLSDELRKKGFRFTRVATSADVLAFYPKWEGTMEEKIQIGRGEIKPVRLILDGSNHDARLKAATKYANGADSIWPTFASKTRQPLTLNEQSATSRSSSSSSKSSSSSVAQDNMASRKSMTGKPSFNGSQSSGTNNHAVKKRVVVVKAKNSLPAHSSENDLVRLASQSSSPSTVAAIPPAIAVPDSLSSSPTVATTTPAIAVPDSLFRHQLPNIITREQSFESSQGRFESNGHYIAFHDSVGGYNPLVSPSINGSSQLHVEIPPRAIGAETITPNTSTMSASVDTVTPNSDLLNAVAPDSAVCSSSAASTNNSTSPILAMLQTSSFLTIKLPEAPMLRAITPEPMKPLRAPELKKSSSLPATPAPNSIKREEIKDLEDSVRRIKF
jgi:hypothetical protein